MKKIINTKNAPAPIGPYNQAVIHNDVLYTSGQIALDPKTGTLYSGGDIKEETRMVMENIKAILKEAKISFDHVLKATIFVSNMDDFGHINEVYGSYFKEDTAPARETVEVARLPRSVGVEISVIAVWKSTDESW